VNTFKGAIVAHFPDFGLLKFTAEDPEDLLCREEFIPSAEMSGLCLGYKNTGGHNRMFSYHHGLLKLSFSAGVPRDKMELILAVEPEMHPEIEFPAEDRRWDGLRRCWMNSFTLAKDSLTMGDNTALSGIAHLAMHFKADMIPHTPSFSNGVSVRDFMKRALFISFEKAVSKHGEINWEHMRGIPGDRKMASFIDSTPSALLAFSGHCLDACDKDFASEYMTKAVNAAEFLMGLDEDSDGVIEVPFHGNFFEELPGRNRNWWDNFAFGHKDIYFNLLCQKALKRLARLISEFNFNIDVSKIESFTACFARNFDRIFFNAKTGVYAGWISRDGRMHDHMFTFASAMAINEGLVPRSKARKVLKILLRKMRENGFGDFRYGIPGPAVPVSPEDTIKWDTLGAWPWYENGGLCGQNAFHFIMALYNAGMLSEADDIFFRMLASFEEEFTQSGLMPGYRNSVDWRTKDGRASGYNYLADNYYFLLAGVRRKEYFGTDILLNGKDLQ